MRGDSDEGSSRLGGRAVASPPTRQSPWRALQLRAARLAFRKASDESAAPEPGSPEVRIDIEHGDIEHGGEAHGGEAVDDRARVAELAGLGRVERHLDAARIERVTRDAVASRSPCSSGPWKRVSPLYICGPVSFLPPAAAAGAVAQC